MVGIAEAFHRLFQAFCFADVGTQSDPSRASFSFRGLSRSGAVGQAGPTSYPKSSPKGLLLVDVSLISSLPSTSTYKATSNTYLG